MNVHKNARLTPCSRAELVRRVLQENQRTEAIAQAMGVSPRTVSKWVARFRKEGAAGLVDRSSRPQRLFRPTPGIVAEQIERLRRLRFTGKQIAKDAEKALPALAKNKRAVWPAYSLRPLMTRTYFFLPFEAY